MLAPMDKIDSCDNNPHIMAGKNETRFYSGHPFDDFRVLQLRMGQKFQIGRYCLVPISSFATVSLASWKIFPSPLCFSSPIPIRVNSLHMNSVSPCGANKNPAMILILSYSFLRKEKKVPFFRNSTKGITNDLRS
jgi:hypothetical protein